MINKVDQSVISMYLEEYFGNFLFGPHNPYKCEKMMKDDVEQKIMKTV